MRSPTIAEIEAIQVALDEEMGGCRDWEPNPDYIGVIDSYTSDGPSWCGKAAVFLGGEVCFVTVALFDSKTGAVTLSTAELLHSEPR